MKVSIRAKKIDDDEPTRGQRMEVKSGEAAYLQPDVRIESWKPGLNILSIRLEGYSEQRSVHGVQYHREAYVEFTKVEFADMVAKAIKAGFVEPPCFNVVEEIESHLTAALEQLQALKGEKE